MRRLSGVILAACLLSGGAAAEQPHAWPPTQAPGFVGRDPWTDTIATASGQDDAYVFADVQGGPLSRDAIAAAVRSDVERMSRTSGDRGRQPRLTDARVSSAFDRFAPTGGDGRAYVSLDLIRDRVGPASLTEAMGAAELAMASPLR